LRGVVCLSSPACRRAADVYFNFDWFNLAGNQDWSSKPKAKIRARAEFEKALLIGLRTEADVFFNFDLLNLAGEPRSDLEAKDKCRVLKFENIVY